MLVQEANMRCSVSQRDLLSTSSATVMLLEQSEMIMSVDGDLSSSVTANVGLITVNMAISNASNRNATTVPLR